MSNTTGGIFLRERQRVGTERSEVVLHALLSDFIRNESKVSKLSRCALPRKPDTRGDAEY